MLRFIQKLNICFLAIVFFRIGIFYAENPTFDWSMNSAYLAMREILSFPRVELFLAEHRNQILYVLHEVLLRILFFGENILSDFQAGAVILGNYVV